MLLKKPGEDAISSAMFGKITYPLALLLVACAGSAPSQETAQPTPIATTAPKEVKEIRQGYELHDTFIVDEYLALEKDTPETRAWMAEQNARTLKDLNPSSEMKARISAHLKIDSLSGVRSVGERIFYMHREGDGEQPILMMQKLNSRSRKPSGDAAALINPSDFGERPSLDWYYPSPSGKLLAFGISHNGDERSILHILNVDKKTLRKERIPRCKWTSLSWLRDESGFYYTRYPNQGEPHFDPEHEDGYFPQVFFRKLGEEKDTWIFAGKDATDFPQLSQGTVDRYLPLDVFRGWTKSEVYLFDRGAKEDRIAPTEDAPFGQIIGGKEAINEVVAIGDMLYRRTNEDAPRYKFLQAKANKPSEWTTIVEENPNATVETWTVEDGTLAIHSIENVHSTLQACKLTNQKAQCESIELPSIGRLSGLSVSTLRKKAQITYAFSSLNRAPSIQSLTPGKKTYVVKAVSAPKLLDDLEVVQEHALSKDGTKIPITLVRKKGFVKNGKTPVLLYGYGGFNVSLLPGFRRNILYWLEQGGVFAVANIRGGGEFGEEWHRAGHREHKQNVFDDFAAAIKWLSESGISNKDKIAITGGSNGGLLMGAMITQVPETFAAAASYVGLYDMLRYHHFPPAELWISEYGSAEKAEDFAFIKKYSPYNRIENNTQFPAILVETASHDSRVHWAHSTKFVARLQKANASTNPVYFFIEEGAGHGAGKGFSTSVEQYARMFAFIERSLSTNAPTDSE